MLADRQLLQPCQAVLSYPIQHKCLCKEWLVAFSMMTIRLLGLISLVALSFRVSAQQPQSGAGNATPQNTPCADQPTTRKKLAASFQSGRLPLASQVTGTWVEIGELSDYPLSPPFRNMNCSGVMRDDIFEFVLVADGYTVELHAVGAYIEKVKMQPDGKGAVTFPVDFAADEGPDTYRCRLTKRGTLACLIREHDGAEFKKMKVAKSQIYEASEDF